MRDTERERAMEILRERTSERKTKRYSMKVRHQQRRREKDLFKKMAFNALNLLDSTIRGLVNSSRLSIDSRSREFLTFAGYGVKEAVELLKSLEDFRECIEDKRMKALDAEISEAARELEDKLDSHVFDQILPQSEARERSPLLYSLTLLGIEQDVDAFVEKIAEMEMVLNPWMELEEDEEKESDVCEESVTRSLFISVFAAKAASVFSGMKEEYIQELEKLLPEDEECDNYALLFQGEFSRSKFNDLFRRTRDELIIWWLNKVASNFVKEDEEEQLDNPLPKDDEDSVSSTTGHALNVSNMVGSTDLFCQIRNVLIGDEWGSEVGSIIGMAGIGKTALAQRILQDPLISTKFECRIFVRLGPKYQPEEIMQAILAQMPNGDKMHMAGHGDLDENLVETLKVTKCLIVLDDVWDKDIWSNILSEIFALNYRSSVLITTRKNQVAHSDGRKYQMPFLNKEESWDLLREKIFGEKACPRELQKAGEKIAENCEGLPLLVITVADLLSKVEKTPEYWIKIAADKRNSIFVEAYDQISQVVYPSYYYLPQRLKACFLYLGAFPQNDEIRLSKLMCLWSVDRFLGLSFTLLQKYLDDLVRELFSENVALGIPGAHKLKVCSLHSVFWYLCKREAWNENFILVLNSYKDAAKKGIESGRRLSIYQNAILSIKEVRDSIASMSVVRSLLCTGPYHQYQVPIYFGLKLLKVLDALSIRFYEFPLDVLKLIQLKYLGLTCNENLPPSISKLWSLQSLIVHQHQSIKSSVSQTYLPVEIWYLQELEFLQIVGRNLPDPPPGVVLKNLLILLDVGAHTCTERVLGSIPNLEKLRVQIELTPVAAEPQSFCDVISPLSKLMSIKCVVVNPELMFETFFPVPLFSASYLEKLTLSGCGHPWKNMDMIAELPHLQELKLKCYAFQGEKWEVKENGFRWLTHLSIEDTDLVQWTSSCTAFPRLYRVSLKNCYVLQEIPNISSLRSITLDDCHPSAATCAKQMECCDVQVDYSYLGK